MKYFETELIFTPATPPSESRSRGNLHSSEQAAHSATGILGITLRLGNQPLVYDLKALCQRSGKPAPISEQDHYLVVHAISALRTRGNARVDELHYFAAATHPQKLQTVDMVPKTRFNTSLNANLDLGGCLDLFGEVSLNLPLAMPDNLLDEYIELATGMQLQLSASARFIGRFVYTLKIPVVQASGIGSDSCIWILKPDENKTPLLGDQLLIQSIAVPKGTRKLNYKIWGLVKADKGLFWKQQEKKTPDHIVEINLDQIKINTKL